ncbi:unnamed protein product, partial [Effrenium voratum]
MECLRDSPAQAKLLEVLPEETTPKLKVLFNPKVGFSHRLYMDFNLVLKQVKLRQLSLESLTQRPDLCLPSKCPAARLPLCVAPDGDVEVSRGLNQLMDMKRAERPGSGARESDGNSAERIHMLKLMSSFPSSSTIEDIETQYGDFVNERELHGGCADDAKSAHSKMTGRTGRSGRSGRSRRSGRSESSRPSGSGSRAEEAAEVEPDEDDSDLEEDSIHDQAPPRNAKMVNKSPLDATNPNFERSLHYRKQEQLNLVSSNKQALTELSRTMKESGEPTEGGAQEGRGQNLPGAGRGDPYLLRAGQKHRGIAEDGPTGEDEGPGGQPAADLQRGEELGLLSHAGEGCALGQDAAARSTAGEDGRKTFKYPSPRQVEDYRRMPNQVSDARKEDLQCQWVENQLHPELKMKEIVTGAFDARSLGSGGQVLDLRRPCLFEPCQAVQEEKLPQMKFQARNVMGIENAMDKHHRTMMDGKPQSLGMCFDERRPPRAIRQKYGKRRADTVLEVEQPPISFQRDEDYREDKGTYESISGFMNAVRRPLAPAKGEWNHSQHLNSMQNKTNCLKKSQNQAWKAVSIRPKPTIPDPPNSARSWSKEMKASGAVWTQYRQ